MKYASWKKGKEKFAVAVNSEFTWHAKLRRNALLSYP